MKRKNGIPIDNIDRSKNNKNVIGYNKKINGFMIEIFAEAKNVQSDKLKRDGFKNIYE